MPLDPFLLIAGVVVGLIMGSFFSMLTWRLPRQMLAQADRALSPASTEETPPLWSWRSRSQCPHCRASLPWHRLIPLFSWLASGGRCHACRHAIGWRYPVIELATASLTASALLFFAPTLQGAFAVLFGWLALLIAIVDWEFKLIPDLFSYPLLWLGLIASTFRFWSDPTASIWGAVVGWSLLWAVYWLFRLLSGKEGMGYGDFKMMAAMGAWFGLGALPFLLLTSSLLAIVVQSIMRLLGRGQEAFAFGPYIALSGGVLIYAPDAARYFPEYIGHFFF